MLKHCAGALKWDLGSSPEMFTSGDGCKDYLARTILSMCGGNSDRLDKLSKGTDQVLEELCSDPAMDTFLDQASSAPLQASLMQGGDVKLGNEVSVSSQAMLVIFFSKAERDVTPDNIQQAVSISSMSQSAIKGFYNQIHNVFMPLINLEGAADPKVKPLQALVQDLDAGLGSLARGSGEGNSIDEASVSGIMKLEDEVKFWSDMRSSTGDDEVIDKAEFVKEKVSEIIQCFSEDDDTFEDMVVDRLERVAELLEEVWLREGNGGRSSRYPQSRMERLMKLCGDSCAQVSQDCSSWQLRG